MNKDHLEQTLSEALSVVPETYALTDILLSGKKQTGALVKKLSDLIAQVPPEFKDALTYHYSRLLHLSGKPFLAIKLLDTLTADDALLPEALWLQIQLCASGTDQASKQLRWRLEDRLGILLPMSTWGTLRDNRLVQIESERTGQPLSDPGPEEVIPIIEGPEKLVQISSLFAEQKMYKEAANAYREAVYSGFSPPEFPTPGGESWISSDAGAVWLSIAHIESNLGLRHWVFQALCMAVASDSSLLGKAQKILAGMFGEQDKRRHPAPDVMKLKHIASLYREMNLHPRAISALQTAARIPGADVAAMEKEIIRQWTKMLKDYPSKKGDTEFIFGKNLTTTPPMLVVPDGIIYEVK